MIHQIIPSAQTKQTKQRRSIVAALARGSGAQLITQTRQRRKDRRAQDRRVWGSVH
jgi:hypothetical protein